MKRAVFLVAVLFVGTFLSACGGGGGSSLGTLPAVPNGGDGTSAVTTPTSVTFTKHDTTDTLTGGLTIGDDGSLYATTPVGLDIFGPYTPFQSAMRHILTWPVIGGLKPATQTQDGTGDSVWTLATQSTGTANAASLQGLTSSGDTPVLVVYSIHTASFTVIRGTTGDSYAGLAAGGDHPTFVSANTPTSTGPKGYVFGVGCLETKVQMGAALGPITFRHADDNLYVATDPTIDPSTPSEILSLNSNTGLKFAPVVLPAGSHVTDITEGSDGNVWFTDAGLNKIGKLDHGVVSYFTIPTPASLPERITLGSDHALWFTEHDANAIGRITTDGTVTEYPVPQASAGVIGIAGCSCQGKVYFTETHAVGRITF